MVSNYTGNYTFGENGVIIPDTSEIQQTVQQEYQNALGSDLSLEESTPQGRLIDTETTARQAVLNFNATIANNLINILLSSGSTLDAWAANFQIYRNGATASSVVVTVTGVPNTVIPANAQASTADGVIWLCESEIIIGSSGTATGTFICSNTGPVSLGIGELTNIVATSTTGLNGWETITNTSAATLGATQESDSSLKARLLESIFLGTALFGNYASACYQVENVVDVFAYDNPNGSPLILDDITIPAHSVYVCVDGGNSSDVAAALYAVKSAGCGWCGNTTVSVTDTTYNTTTSVTYQTPTPVAIKILVNVSTNNNSNSNLEELIQNTIVNYFNNEYLSNNIQKVGIRSLISPFIIASVLISQISNLQTLEVQVGLVEPAPHAVATIKKASVTQGLQWASVNSETFASQVSSNGTYNFTYNGTNWLLNSSPVTLSTYGISIVGAPITNDTISIIYANGELSQSPINLFASEAPLIDTSNITVNIND